MRMPFSGQGGLLTRSLGVTALPANAVRRTNFWSFIRSREFVVIRSSASRRIDSDVQRLKEPIIAPRDAAEPSLAQQMFQGG
jgi:hypothetical protein